MKKRNFFTKLHGLHQHKRKKPGPCNADDKERAVITVLSGAFSLSLLVF
jgi:hypothetical protein